MNTLSPKDYLQVRNKLDLYYSLFNETDKGIIGEIVELKKQLWEENGK